MEVRQLDPNDLEIDPLNERTENVGPHKDQDSLENSIAKQGLIQPPVARVKNDQYRVIVGQRRTLAAQAVGLEKIPVIVVDWDDAEALQATITENADVLRKRVSKSDRASAIRALLDLTNWTVSELSEELGVSSTTIDNWIERTRDEWEETSVHVEPRTKQDEDGVSSTIESHSPEPDKMSREEVEKISDTNLRTIRTATSSPDEREEVVREVVKSGLTSEQIREAKTRAERGGTSLVEEVRQISKDNRETEGEIRVRTEVTFTGEYGRGLQMAARDAGTSEEEIVRQAIERYLKDQGYI